MRSVNKRTTGLRSKMSEEIEALFAPVRERFEKRLLGMKFVLKLPKFAFDFAADSLTTHGAVISSSKKERFWWHWLWVVPYETKTYSLDPVGMEQRLRAVIEQQMHQATHEFIELMQGGASAYQERLSEKMEACQHQLKQQLDMGEENAVEKRERASALHGLDAMRREIHRQASEVQNALPPPLPAHSTSK